MRKIFNHAVIIFEFLLFILLILFNEKIADYINVEGGSALLFFVAIYILPFILIEFIRNKIFGIPTIYEEIINLDISFEKIEMRILEFCRKNFSIVKKERNISIFEKEEKMFFGSKLKDIVLVVKIDNTQEQMNLVNKYVKLFRKKVEVRKNTIYHIYIILFDDKLLLNSFDLLNQGTYINRNLHDYTNLIYRTSFMISIMFDKVNNCLRFPKYSWDLKFFKILKENILNFYYDIVNDSI